MKSLTRVASHADGWYSGNPQELAKELNKYLSKSEKYEESSSLKSIIVPHSGLCYGGPTAAKAFINVNPSQFDRAIILGPSHYEYFQGIGLTSFEKFETPFGDVDVDTKIAGMRIIPLAIESKRLVPVQVTGPPALPPVAWINRLCIGIAVVTFASYLIASKIFLTIAYIWMLLRFGEPSGFGPVGIPAA